jgi:hypothetical protein
VLQQTTAFGTTDERLVIVYLNGFNSVEYDVVSRDTLGRIPNGEPEGKRARC